MPTRRQLTAAHICFGQKAVDALLDNRCPFCGTLIANEVFRDELSRRDNEVTGLCQKCQDEHYTGED